MRTIYNNTHAFKIQMRRYGGLAKLYIASRRIGVDGIQQDQGVLVGAQELHGAVLDADAPAFLVQAQDLTAFRSLYKELVETNTTQSAGRSAPGMNVSSG